MVDDVRQHAQVLGAQNAAGAKMAAPDASPPEPLLARSVRGLELVLPRWIARLMRSSKL